jgi:hypothetical protein
MYWHCLIRWTWFTGKRKLLIGIKLPPIACWQQNSQSTPVLSLWYFKPTANAAPHTKTRCNLLLACVAVPMTVRLTLIVVL